MGPLAGQVLGTVGKDGYGQLGLEYFLDKELRGTDGWKYVRQDVKRRYYPGFSERQKEAENGLNVILTLDAKLQGILEHALERGVQKAGARQGVAIVVEPRTGDILAMANYPFYNPNTREATDGETWKNHAVTKVYEPGSTFKAITAAALLEEKLIELGGHHRRRERHATRFGGETIRDTKPHAVISFRDAMAYSSNIVFAKTAPRLKPETFYRYIRSFGFGIKTGVGLPAEESGVLKPVGTWSGRTQSTIAFGHEISATPLQVAMAFAAVANGGMLMKPRIVRGWADDAGSMVRETPAPRRAPGALRSHRRQGQVHAGRGGGIRHRLRHPDRSHPPGRQDRHRREDRRGDRPLREGPVQLLLRRDGAGGQAPRSWPWCSWTSPPSSSTEARARRPSSAKWWIACWPIRNSRSPAAPRPSAASVPPPRPDFAAAVRGLLPGAGPARLPPGRRHAAPGRDRRGRQGGGEGELILSQDPKPGRRLPAGGAVTLTLGFLESRVMPDLENDTLRDALLKLKNLGLDVEYTGAGRIIRQEPAAGAAVKPGPEMRAHLGMDGMMRLADLLREAGAEAPWQFQSGNLRGEDRFPPGEARRPLPGPQGRQGRRIAICRRRHGPRRRGGAHRRRGPCRLRSPPPLPPR